MIKGPGLLVAAKRSSMMAGTPSCND